MKFFQWLCFTILLTSVSTNEKEQKVVYRLPGVVIPTHYDIKLFLQKDIFTTNVFNGQVTIFFTMKSATNELKLHANNIHFTKVAVQTLVRQQEILNENIKSDPVTDILTLRTTNMLNSQSNYSLELKYRGKLRTDEATGFYKSSYFAPNGSEIFLSTTQFEPTSARKAFPCFDEPSYKATFKITIRHPSQYSAVSNTAGTSRPDEKDGSYTVTTFEQTPKMSTYLVAFVVSDYTCDEGNIDKVTKHFVCSPAETASNRKIAAETAPKLVGFMEKWTGIQYNNAKITKLHHFPIPDYGSGAMENWGLITYREEALLWDKDTSSTTKLQHLKQLIAHEVAHMWFGNYVTLHWWSDAFLNEGFAQFFEFFGTAQIEPSWELDKQFVVAKLQSVLAIDSLPNSEALSWPVSAQTEIMERFGPISYNKGACVLRMINHIMGSVNFRNGVRKYLRDNKFGNTKPGDLWSALQTTVKGLPPDTNLAQVIENWIVKPGYPVLKVKSDRFINITISQKQFLTSGKPSNVKWYVPISYTTSYDKKKFEHTSAKVWLRPNDNLVLPNVLIGANDWIILNNKQIGYYRIDYDDILWTRIKNALSTSNFSGIHELNRAQIIDDYYNFAKAGIHSYSDFLDLVKFLKNETSYYPWFSALTAFSQMLQKIGNNEIRQALSNYVIDVMGTLYSSVPFNKSNHGNHMYTLKRELAVTWACFFGRKDCIKNAVAAFRRYRSSKKRPDKNLKPVVYCMGLMHSTDPRKDWQYVWNDFKTIRLAAERRLLVEALGCAKDKDIHNRLFRYLISPKANLKYIDLSTAFLYMNTINPEAVDICLDFLLLRYKKISHFYHGMNMISTLLNVLVSKFTRKEQTAKLSTFLSITTNLPESFVTSVRKMLAEALVNLKETEKLEKELSTYFKLGKIEVATIKTRMKVINLETTLRPRIMILITMLFSFYLL